MPTDSCKATAGEHLSCSPDGCADLSKPLADCLAHLLPSFLYSPAVSSEGEDLCNCCRRRQLRTACSSLQAGARGRCTIQAERAVHLAWWVLPCWTGCFPADHVCWPGTLAAAVHACVWLCVVACHGRDACMRSGADTCRWCWQAGGRPLTFAVFGWLLPTPPASAPSLLASSAFALAVSGYSEFAALPAPTFACFMLGSQWAVVPLLCLSVNNLRVTKSQEDLMKSQRWSGHLSCMTCPPGQQRLT